MPIIQATWQEVGRPGKVIETQHQHQNALPTKAWKCGSSGRVGPKINPHYCKNNNNNNKILHFLGKWCLKVFIAK
jgi:hypothetical protein